MVGLGIILEYFWVNLSLGITCHRKHTDEQSQISFCKYYNFLRITLTACSLFLQPSSENSHKQYDHVKQSDGRYSGDVDCHAQCWLLGGSTTFKAGAVFSVGVYCGVRLRCHSTLGYASSIWHPRFWFTARLQRTLVWAWVPHWKVLRMRALIAV